MALVGMLHRNELMGPYAYIDAKFLKLNTKIILRRKKLTKTPFTSEGSKRTG